MTLTKDDVRAGLMPDEPRYDELARTFGTDALVFLRELAESPDSLLASKAVSLAGTIGGTGAAEVLRLGAAHTDTGVRAAAAYGLQRLDVKDAEPMLMVLLDDPDPSVLKFAIRTAGRFPESVTLRNKLVNLKKSSKELVRTEAIKALSR
jgi:HEAT repeat protein